MICYKGFRKDLTCRGYQFCEGVNITEAANCRKNGFHAAENPLDCLTYYPDMKNSVYYECEAAGDVDEDSVDSKISCTRLTLLRRLDRLQFVLAAMTYVLQHPRMPMHPRICLDRGAAGSDGFCIVSGENPLAWGPIGALLGYIVRNPNGKMHGYIHYVDGKDYRPGVYYDWFGDAYDENGKILSEGV